MDPVKVQKLKSIKLPTNKKQVRQFLGLAGYFRDFIKDFAEIAAPLTDLTKDSHIDTFVLTEKEKLAAELLKQKVSEYPILQFPDFNLPFILKIDASQIKIVAVLLQQKQQQRVLISCSSRLLSPAERNYSIVEREALAVVWGINHYRPYLFGRNFLIITDHKSLQYLYNFRDPNGRLVRWILALQEYDFEVQYRSGAQNTIADALSRLPLEEDIGSLEILTPSLQFDIDISDINSLEEVIIEDIIPKIASEQQLDKFCRPIIDYLKFNILPDNPKEIAQILYHAKFMVVDNNILYNLWYVISDKRMRQFIKQIVIPKALQQEILKLVHCDKIFSSHKGVTKCYEALRTTYYWKNMFSDLTEFISKCDICQRKKNPVGHLRIRPSTLSRPVPTKPWEIVCSDVFHLPLSENLNQWVLIFCDTFSKFVEATPLITVNGILAAECLMKTVVLKHGCPVQLITDNASYYVKGNFPQLCNFLGIKLSPVTAYHPQANGIAESKVKALKNIIRALVKENHTNWDQLLPYALFSFNTAFNQTIGCSPFFANHGQEPNFPGKIPMALALNNSQNSDNNEPNQYCTELYSKMSVAHE